MKSGIMNFVVFKHQETDGKPDPVIVAAFSDRSEAIQWKTFMKRRTGEYYQMARMNPKQIDFEQFNQDLYMKDFDGWKERSEIFPKEQHEEDSQEKKLIPQKRRDPKPYTFADRMGSEEHRSRRF